MTPITHRTAKTRLRRGLGLETIVDHVANVVFVLGVLLSLGLLFTASWWGVLAAGSSVLASFVHWLLLRCMAEHLRLQKKIAGYEFEGQISGPQQESIWVCGSCGQMLHSETRCDSCNAQISQDDTGG